MTWVHWTIAAVIGVGLMGLAFTVGWLSRERARTPIVQAIIGAGFVAVAVGIVIIQVNVVMTQHDTVICNSDLIDALSVRNKAQVTVNQEGIHFHQHLVTWLDAQSEVPQDIPVTTDALTQLRDSLDKLVRARQAAILVEDANPLPVCRRN
jgi:hypothetical protein